MSDLFIIKIQNQLDEVNEQLLHGVEETSEKYFNDYVDNLSEDFRDALDIEKLKRETLLGLIESERKFLMWKKGYFTDQLESHKKLKKLLETLF